MPVDPLVCDSQTGLGGLWPRIRAVVAGPNHAEFFGRAGQSPVPAQRQYGLRRAATAIGSPRRVADLGDPAETLTLASADMATFRHTAISAARAAYSIRSKVSPTASQAVGRAQSQRVDATIAGSCPPLIKSTLTVARSVR